MTYALEVNDITKSFGKKKKFYALRNVSFKIKQGEIFGLLGPNGAGKTSLMNAIIGLLTPDKGDINILGQGQHRDVFSQINGVSGDSHFHWALTGNDVMKFYGKAYGIKGDDLKKRIKELVGIFEIQDIMDKKFSWLSTGERMRLVFAKSLINNPKLLLLDEPTLGLDPDIAIKCSAEILKRKKGEPIIGQFLSTENFEKMYHLSGHTTLSEFRVFWSE